MKTGKRLIVVFVVLMIVISQGAQQSNAQKKQKTRPQSSIADSGWPTYGRDPGGSRYSPLAEINRENVNNLKAAWTYRAGFADIKAASAKQAAFEATPILADGLLYLTTPYSRVIALDPMTGAERWTFDPQVKLDRGYSEVTSRGVAAWPGPDDTRKVARRIFVGTLDARLIALDAATGKSCADFGENGQIDLTRDVRMGDHGNYQITSPTAVSGGAVVVGSSIGDNRGVELERGVVRAYGARAGAGTRSQRAQKIRRARPGKARAPTALARPTPGRSSQPTLSSAWSSSRRAAPALIFTAANAKAITGTPTPSLRFGPRPARSSGVFRSCITTWGITT